MAEHISKHLQEVAQSLESQQGQSSLSVSLKTKSALTPEENKIIELKYASKQIGGHTEAQLSMEGKGLLTKIHVITGWTIPVNELLNILVDQFNKHLKEKYYMLNCDEIEYAFRKNGTQISDWGKAMNLNLIDTVLVPYLNERFEASQLEEKIKRENPPQRIFTQDELDNGAREDAERQYQCFLKRIDLKGVEFNKSILEKDGLIKEGESVIDFFTRSATSGKTNIYIKQ